jgi:hypothetical protein
MVLVFVWPCAHWAPHLIRSQFVLWQFASDSYGGAVWCAALAPNVNAAASSSSNGSGSAGAAGEAKALGDGSDKDSSDKDDDDSDSDGGSGPTRASAAAAAAAAAEEPRLLAVGCEDGSVRLFDISDTSQAPIYKKALMKHDGEWASWLRVVS